MDKEKQDLLNKLNKHIVYIKEKVDSTFHNICQQNTKTDEDVRSLSADDRAQFFNIKIQLDKRLEELRDLKRSPYFVKCEIEQDDSKEIVTRYFAKFQFTEESIYSWVSPISSIRFEKPGKISYRLPNGKLKLAKLISKEEYIIVDGKANFFSRESIKFPRQIIYQDLLPPPKTGFMLPEIIAQIEKAQDEVVRAHHKGPLVITGPAGSGKTTLAFHRIAYLLQAPDTKDVFLNGPVVIFVQDCRTKEYFSYLLPCLGVENVTMTTFSEWALSVLGLDNHKYTVRCGKTEEDKDIYEYEKLKVLRSKKVPEYNKNPFISLDSLYKGCFSKNKYGNFLEQKKQKLLDRFDLTLLLKSYIKKNGKLKFQKNKKDVLYSMILIDEFQNYLPEQLMILRNSLDSTTESIIYVGDIAQQISLGTIHNWQDVEEKIPKERSITLSKVYRNTKKILQYILGLGYDISLPNNIKEGVDVKEVKIDKIDDQISYVKKIIKKENKKTFGILTNSDSCLKKFKTVFNNQKNVYVFFMNESQGVEFDVVFMVGIDRDAFIIKHIDDRHREHFEERVRIQKDLLYVALTRAISELHILGKDKLSEIFGKI